MNPVAPPTRKTASPCKCFGFKLISDSPTRKLRSAWLPVRLLLRIQYAGCPGRYQSGQAKSNNLPYQFVSSGQGTAGVAGRNPLLALTLARILRTMAEPRRLYERI